MIVFLSDDAILLRERKTEEEKEKAIVFLRSNSDSDLYHTFNFDEYTIPTSNLLWLGVSIIPSISIHFCSASS